MPCDLDIPIWRSMDHREKLIRLIPPQENLFVGYYGY